MASSEGSVEAAKVLIKYNTCIDSVNEVFVTTFILSYWMHAQCHLDLHRGSLIIPDTYNHVGMLVI